MKEIKYKFSKCVSVNHMKPFAQQQIDENLLVGLPTFHIRMKTDAKKTRMNINMKSDPFMIEHVQDIDQIEFSFFLYRILYSICNINKYFIRFF